MSPVKCLGHGCRKLPGMLICLVLLWAALHTADVAGDGRYDGIVRIEELANVTLRLGCYNNTVLDDLGVGTNSTFTFLNATTSDILKKSPSPYFNITIQKSDNTIRIRCVHSASALFHTLLQQHPSLIGITPPVYEIKALYYLEYDSSLVMSNTPAPCDTVTCPYVGSSPVSYFFFMNIDGPFSCSSICDTCNISDPCSTRDPITPSQQQQCYSAQDTACFRHVSGSSQTVTVKPFCYGCLTCEASNTVNGKTTTERRSFNLNRPDSSCGTCDTVNSGSFLFSGDPIVSPSANITVGTPELNITFEFFNRHPTSVTVYNATTRSLIPVFRSSVYHDTTPKVISFDSCKYQYRLTIQRPKVSEGGVLLFEFLSGSGRKYYKNVTIHITERLCKDSQLACRSGRCFLDWSGQPGCVCNPNQFGQSCQLQCPTPTGSSVPLVSTQVIIPVGCDVTILLNCSNAGNRTSTEVTWKQNDGLAVAHGRIYPFLHNSISRRFAGNYSCLDTSTSEYLGSVLVYIADSPVLSNPVNNQLFLIANQSQSRGVSLLAIDSSQTYNATNVDYTWTATGGSLCGWTRDACVLQKNSPVLGVLYISCCSGRYRGCASNDYGSTCVTVQVEVTGSAGCPTKPARLGSTGNMQINSGRSYVDFVGGEGSIVNWYLVNDTSQSPRRQTPSQLRSDGNSSCCCRRSELTGVPSGSYIPCVAARDGAPEQCYPLTVSYSSPEPSGASDVRIIAPASAVGGLAVLALLVFIAYRWKKSNTDAEYHPGDHHSINGDLGAGDDAPEEESRRPIGSVRVVSGADAASAHGVPPSDEPVVKMQSRGTTGEDSSGAAPAGETSRSSNSTTFHSPPASTSIASGDCQGQPRSNTVPIGRTSSDSTDTTRIDDSCQFPEQQAQSHGSFSKPITLAIGQLNHETYPGNHHGGPHTSALHSGFSKQSETNDDDPEGPLSKYRDAISDPHRDLGSGNGDGSNVQPRMAEQESRTQWSAASGMTSGSDASRPYDPNTISQVKREQGQPPHVGDASVKGRELPQKDFDNLPHHHERATDYGRRD